MDINTSNPESFKTATDEELRKHLCSGLKSTYNDPTIGELIIRLRSSIEKFDKTSSKQTRQMIYLTWIIAVLTLLLLVRTFIYD